VQANDRSLHTYWRPDRSFVSDANIHNNGSDIVNAHGSAFGVGFDRFVTNASREFHNSVMYLDTDGTGNDIWLPIKRSHHVVPNLHVICHQVVPSLARPPATSHKEKIRGSWKSRDISAAGSTSF
jgi:hypothetical protein